MKIGDIVVHYSYGSLVEDLGVVTDLVDGDFCEVWYPSKNIKIINLISNIKVIASWDNLGKTMEDDLAQFDDVETWIERYEGYIKEFKAGRSVVGWTLADAERELAKLKNDIEKAKKLKKVAKHPAYQSVGIWFETEPTTKQIKLMKERALKLAKIHKEYGIKIEGFRLISFKKTKSEKKITI